MQELGRETREVLAAGVWLAATALALALGFSAADMLSGGVDPAVHWPYRL